MEIYTNSTGFHIFGLVKLPRVQPSFKQESGLPFSQNCRSNCNFLNCFFMTFHCLSERKTSGVSICVRVFECEWVCACAKHICKHVCQWFVSHLSQSLWCTEASCSDHCSSGLQRPGSRGLHSAVRGWSELLPSGSGPGWALFENKVHPVLFLRRWLIGLLMQWFLRPVGCQAGSVLSLRTRVWWKQVLLW